MSALADRLARLTPEQRATLLARLGRAPDVETRITPGLHGPVRPLSSTQERLWFLEQFAPHQPFNVMSGVATVPFPLDAEGFMECVSDIVARHEILRTSFGVHDGEPVARVASNVDVPCRVLTGLSGSPLDTEFTNDARTPFDLSVAPLMRLTVVPAADSTQIQLTMHHLISDGFSNGILFRELAEIWEARTHQRLPDLPPLPFQFSDVVDHHRHHAASDEGSQEVDFWVTHLRGAPERLTLRTTWPRPARMTYRGARLPVSFPAALVEQIRATAAARMVTPFVVVLAGYAAVLSRFAAQDEVVVGVPVAGRDDPGSEQVIGPFLNTLAMRFDVSDDPAFASLIDRVGSLVTNGMRHQAAPFEEVLRALKVARDPARSPIYQAMLNFQADQTGGQGGFQLQDLHNGSAQVDLRLDLVSTGRGIGGHVDYASDLYDPSAVQSILDALMALLAAGLRHPDLPVGTLPLMSDRATSSALAGARARLQEAPTDESLTVHDLFVQQARRTPHRTAIATDALSMSYADLDALTERLAIRMRARFNAEPGSRIGLLLPRSPRTIIALLAVLRAGWSYVPLDPEYPKERLAFISQDADLAGVITSAEDEGLVEEILGTSFGLPVFSMDRDDTDASAASDATAGSGDDGARSRSSGGSTEMYTIYTSGSTGIPKGVQISHRNVVNLLAAMRVEPGITSDDVLLAVTSPSFDIAVLEMLLPLTTGATVVVAGPRDVTDGARLQALLASHHVTIMQATPITWQILLDSGWNGSPRLMALCGGEALPSALAESLAQRVLSLWNMYGPTETTVWSTVHHVAPGSTGLGSVPIGTPIRRTSAIVMDDALHPVPAGVFGELCIGGDGLAMGYLNHPELTAARFVRPEALNGEVVYRTGDFVVARPDGVLEYSSRLDTQVKLRGHRIELGEVESALDRHPAVGRSVVVIRSRQGETDLLAYVQPAEAAGEEPDLRDWLMQHLPVYMVPARTVWLEHLPLTPNGKVDRRALPDPGEPPPTATAPGIDQPETETEQILMGIWSDLLERADFGVDDGFFALGGHSLMATKLVFRVREVTGIELPLQVLFDGEPTIRRIGILLDRGDGAGTETGQQLDLDAESLLAEDIRPDAPLHVHSVRSPQHPFVTGGSGFMGSFLLAEILRTTEATPFCHVRAASEADGLARLRETLDSYGLWEESYAHRIIPVLGDLSRPRIGLSRPMWDHLSEMVDSIFHCGAEVNFLAPYAALKPANVTGTEAVLRLAVNRTTKPVHFVSTTYVFSRFAYPPNTIFTEDMDPIHDLEYTFGYTQSKWVGENFVAEAGRRGLPTFIYRAGRIAGESTTGACQTYDFVWQAVKAAVDLGAAPDIDMEVDITPVDYAVAALVHISKQPELAGHAFHLVSPQPIHEHTLVDWMVARGYTAERLPFDQWCAAMIERAALLSDRTAGALAPFFSGVLPLDRIPPAVFRTDRVDAALEGSGIQCPPIDQELVNLYLDYFVSVGFLPTPADQFRTVDTVEV